MLTTFKKKSVFILVSSIYLHAIAMEDTTKKELYIKLSITQEDQDKHTQKLIRVLNVIQLGPLAKQNKKFPKLSSKKLWKKAKKQILYGANPNVITPVFENTALILIAAYGEEELAQLVLDNGANTLINHQNKEGATALLRATLRNHTKIIQLLLNHRANVTLENKAGMSPLKAAEASGNQELIQLLRSKLITF